jgi:hypothetical protein
VGLAFIDGWRDGGWRDQFIGGAHAPAERIVLDKLRRGVARVRRAIEKARIGDDPRLASKAGYERAWGRQLKEARRFAAEGANLARVLASFERGNPDAATVKMLDRYGFRFLGQRINGLTDYLYQGPLCVLSLEMEISRHIDKDTVNIVELGSGFGKNLFRVWLTGGPPRAKYFAFEFTANGRKCASYLASLEPAIQFETRAFDYYTPRIDGFDRNAKTFVFTSYSIEQIPTLGTALFEELLAMPGLARVVHVEPVGWQRSRTSIVDEVELELQGEVERFARASRFNTDLLTVLEGLEAARRIEIEAIKYDFLAYEPNLPATVIVWKPVRSSRP